MSDPEHDPNDPVWRALDAFKGIEPHPQSRARFWSVIARDETARAAREESSWKPTGIRWLVRYVLPAAGFACAVIALALGGTALIRQYQADREIAENIELYEDLEVIQNISQLASYEEPDEDFDELLK